MEFIVYIDESGDEGLDFSPGKSKRWFILAAALYPANTERGILKMLDSVRETLKKPSDPNNRYYFHWYKLKHEHKIVLTHAIANSDVRIVSIRVDKHKLYETGRWAERENLYWYATKFLLERVSWECGVLQKTLRLAHKRAVVCFSNRGNMKYENLRNYLRRLKSNAEQGRRTSNISWSVIDPDRILTYPPTQRAGLQVVDAICGAFYNACVENSFGFCESSYLRILESKDCVVHDKIWPE